MWRVQPTVFFLLAAAAPISGQDTVIRIDVNLVQVDAVVTDSANEHVSTLKASDFVILQDGKPQTITDFSYDAPGAPLKSTDVRRMVALVVDDLALSSDNVPRVRDALRKFASRELQPGDMVAVIRTSEGMEALQP